MKSIKIVALIVAVSAVAVYFIFSSNKSASADDEIISRQGIHWHPELKIVIKGVEQTIPADVGLFPVERPIHTHDEHGIIHLEIPGLVQKKETKLGEFFKVWGKRFDHDCIFEYCNDQGGRLKMLVNGQESDLFENYTMLDKDRIEIRFE